MNRRYHFRGFMLPIKVHALFELQKQDVIRYLRLLPRLTNHQASEDHWLMTGSRAAICEYFPCYRDKPPGVTCRIKR